MERRYLIFIFLSMSFLKECSSSQCSNKILKTGFMTNLSSSTFENTVANCPRLFVRKGFANKIVGSACIYLVHTVNFYFQKAQGHCAHFRSKFVEPKTPEAYNAFCELTENIVTYIGAQHSGSGKSFIWASSSLDATSALSPYWGSNQPSSDDVDCVIADKGCELLRSDCDPGRNPVCETDAMICQSYGDPRAESVEYIDGFCYSIHTNDFKTWIESEAACRSINGFLAEIESANVLRTLSDAIIKLTNTDISLYVGGYKLAGEDKIRYSYTGSSVPASGIAWANHKKPFVSERSFLSINSQHGLEAGNGKSKMPYICQIGRHDPCQIGMYFLGKCYEAYRDTLTYEECQAKCKADDGAMPEPRSDADWQGIRLAMRFIDANIEQTFIGIQAENGRAYYYSDYKAGGFRYIDCLECIGMDYAGSMTSSYATLLYDEYKDIYSLKFISSSSECMCAFDCEKDNSRCYADNYDHENGRCNECPQDHFGVDCSIKCSWDVCDMEGNFMRKCPLGSYGYNCEHVCSSKCKDISTCSVVTGTCLGCKDGYFGLKCDRPCEKCSSCDHQGKCLDGCPPGTFGDYCEQNCPQNCKHGNCDIKSGECNECIIGFYGDACDKTCNSLCDQSGNTITECEGGTYGRFCEHNCSLSCLNRICSKIHGSCEKCVEGFYGLFCERRCTSCNKCDRNGDCNFDCVIGFYGRYCERICSDRCKNRNCDKDGYCKDCVNGYYGDFCTKKCPTDVCDETGNSLTKCFPGLYGTLCDKVCSPTCFNATCSQITGACDSCISGYYGLFCENQCSPCHKCLRTGLCVEGCPAGKYGIDCADNCKGHCLNDACNMATGHCMECPTGVYKSDCSTNCTNSEDLCDIETGDTVTSCEGGKYGAFCNETCPSQCPDGDCSKTLGNCFTCDKGIYGLKCEKKCFECLLGCDQSGFCIKPENEVTKENGATTANFTCSLGYFGPRCHYKCSPKCYFKNCDVNGNCVECAEGYFGTDCSLTCPHENCDMEGNAVNKSSIDVCGAKKFGENCNQSCSKNCLNNCSRSFGVCDDCKPGFFGRNCDQKCPKCKVCDRYGDCIADCPEGTYGKKCETKCNKKCRFNTCHIQEGNCSYCLPGFFGLFCEKKCGNCKGKCSETGDCLANCTFGYYGEKCDRFCPSQCFLGDCAKDGKCKECNQGFFGDSCSSRCTYDACDFSGNEMPKCNETKYGPKCDLNCSSTCLNRKCQQVTGHCIECIPGFHGILCEHMCSKCSVCERDGTCLSECSPGMYGPKCDKSCKGECLNGYCDKTGGECLECPIGKFGTNCRKDCLNISAPCNKFSGNEIIECEVGKFGTSCTQTCPRNCLGNKCSAVEGTCFACSKELSLYGVKCELQCGNCVEGCDETGKCNPPAKGDTGSSCELGFFGPSCEDLCSSYCLRSDCEKDGACKACPEGLTSKSCDAKCSTNNCDINGRPLSECPVGTFGKTCTEKCSPACLGQKCFSHGVCYDCIQGYYGFDCSHTCTGCDQCDNLGNCISECHYGLYGSKCQFKCSENCFAFNCHPKSGLCLECPIGYYGDDCTKPCRNNAFKCDMNGLQTLLCSQGTFGENCEKNCSTNCKGITCSDSGSCESCFEGFYGAFCDQECGNCGNCNRGGTCVSTTRIDVVTNRTIVVPRCAIGLTGANCDQECSSECLASNCDDDGKCRECPDGKYGKRCEKTCAESCNSNGDPIENVCEVGTFGDNCEYECSSDCKSRDCMMTTGTCKHCPAEKFGKFCEKKCFGSMLCDRSGKPESECFPGFFGERCDKTCSSSCLHGNCDEHGFCLECSKGFYGRDCQSVCNSPVCDIETGENIEECPNGFYGTDCKTPCSDKCENNECSQVMGSCVSCMKGYFGLQCELTCPNCGECDKRGTCLSDCFPGFAGKSCNKACPRNCFIQSCNKAGGCSECEIGFYGITCSKICPDKQLCDIDGNPLKECSLKKYGENCEKSCSKSCKGGCSKLLGICKNCKWGTYGRYCEIKCKLCSYGCTRRGICNPEAAFQDVDDDGNGLIGAFVILGILLTVLGVVALKSIKTKKLIRVEEAAKYSRVGNSHFKVPVQ